MPLVTGYPAFLCDAINSPVIQPGVPVIFLAGMMSGSIASVTPAGEFEPRAPLQCQLGAWGSLSPSPTRDLFPAAPAA